MGTTFSTRARRGVSGTGASSSSRPAVPMRRRRDTPEMYVTRETFLEWQL